MSIATSLEKIRNIKHFAVSKNRYGLDTLSEWFAGDVVETPDYWLIPCSHAFRPPATEAQIAAVETKLEIYLPDQLRELLRLTNGAELFRLQYKDAHLGHYWIARFAILNCSKLAEVNQELLDIFLSHAEYDQEYQGVESLNYVAFCDILDGNYLAIKLGEPNSGTVFFFDHEYGAYPFGVEFTKEAYTPVASSINDWLEQLAQTNGAQGIGDYFVPL